MPKPKPTKTPKIPNRQKSQKPPKIPAGQKFPRYKNPNKNSRPPKIPAKQKTPHKMEHYEKLYDWINQNYSALQISYLNYQNQEKVNFTLYCIAMYVKHQSLFA
jgi:hypothetical protein